MMEYKLINKLDEYTPAKRDWLEKIKEQPIREQPVIPKEPTMPYWPNEPQQDKEPQRGGVIIHPDGTTEIL